MTTSKVWNYLNDFFSKKIPVHLTLIDPDPFRQSAEDAANIAQLAEKAGTNAIMIGGSTGTALIQETTKMISDSVEIPTIIFPGNIDAISAHADAIFFMSLLNSRNPYFIIGAQAISAFSIKAHNLETISLAYLIVEPGATAGYIGEAKLLPRDRPHIAATYALAAEYLGFKMIYLEAGSGAGNSIPIDLVRTVADNLTIPIMVGGGIDSLTQAKQLVKAGANCLVQGTFVEHSIQKDSGKELKQIISALHK
jgi:phosphoglycerol geranylgeranyltransferase